MGRHPGHAEVDEVRRLDALAAGPADPADPAAQGQVVRQDVGEVVAFRQVVHHPRAVIEAVHDADLAAQGRADAAVAAHPSLGLDRREVLGVVQERRGGRVGTQAQDPAASPQQRLEGGAWSEVVVPWHLDEPALG